MRQVYLYYNGSNAPASRDITELFLMEEFHWTPKQIAELSYKSIQKILLMKNQKREVQRVNENIAKTKSGVVKGGKFMREV